MFEQVRGRTTAVACLLLFAFFWVGSVAYVMATGGGPLRPAIALVVFAGVLPGLIWLFTRKAALRPVPVEHPMRELTAVLAYLVCYAFYFLGWATGAVRAATEPGLERDVFTLVLNLGVGVSAPAVLLYLMGAQLGPLFSAGLRRKGFWPILLVVTPILVTVVALAGTNPKIAQGLALPPQTLAWAAPGALLYYALAQGVTEEFLFRAVLQSRLAAVLESEAGAVIISALMFAMARVPEVYFHGGPGVPGWSTNLWHVVAYAVCVNGPLGVMVGVAWARTRSLLLVSLLHGAAYTMIGVANFAANWAVR